VRVTLDPTHCNPYAIGRPTIRPQILEVSRTKVGLSRIRHALNCTKIYCSVHQWRAACLKSVHRRNTPTREPVSPDHDNPTNGRPI
jgi:hypothetical protein